MKRFTSVLTKVGFSHSSRGRTPLDHGVCVGSPDPRDSYGRRTARQVGIELEHRSGVQRFAAGGPAEATTRDLGGP